MEWIDIACIVFICVTANHLGLVSKIEEIYGKSLPVVNCSKCFTFWSVFLYGMVCLTYKAVMSPLTVLAISFLCAYSAIWLELVMGIVDYYYNKVYGKIYTTSDDSPASDAGEGDPAGTMS